MGREPPSIGLKSSRPTARERVEWGLCPWLVAASPRAAPGSASGAGWCSSQGRFLTGFAVESACVVEWGDAREASVQLDVAGCFNGDGCPRACLRSAWRPDWREVGCARWRLSDGRNVRRCCRIPWRRPKRRRAWIRLRINRRGRRLLHDWRVVVALR